MPENKLNSSAPITRQQILLFRPVCFLKQLEQLREGFQTAIYASFVAALLITSILLKIIPTSSSIDWLILFSVVTGVRVYFGLIRNNHQFSIVTASEWYGYFLIGCFVSGGMWCYMGLVLIPNLELQPFEIIYLHAINILFIAGLTAGAMITYKMSILALFTFSLPAIVPYAIYLVMQDDLYTPVLGTVFLIYYLFILMLGISNYQKTAQELWTADHQSTSD